MNVMDWVCIGVYVALALVLGWFLYCAKTERTIFGRRWAYPGCCHNCRGTGLDMGAPETGGKCWDCYGTGHCHPTEEGIRHARRDRKRPLLPRHAASAGGRERLRLHRSAHRS